MFATMHVTLVLVLSCMCFLEVVSPCEDAAVLAQQLKADICATNHSRVQEFYKTLRDAENKHIQFPDSKKSLLTYSLHSGEINWLVGGLAPKLQPYLGKRLQNVSLDLFTWCIYPLTTTLDLYGCINSTDRWSTPEFEALGFLDAINLKNDSRLSYRNGNLLINASQIKHLSALKGAMVSCTIKLPIDLTFGIYFDLDLEPSRGSTFLGISPISEAFLVKGQPKNFTCRFIGDSFPGYGWYKGDENGQYQRICDGYPEMAAEKCSKISTYQLRFRDDKVGECVFTPPQGARFTNDTSYLVFSSPTVNDTGAYKCEDSQYVEDHTITIDVVFTKLPPKQVIVTEGSPVTLACEMKAPSDSVVYFTKKTDHKECMISSTNGTNAGTKEAQSTAAAAPLDDCATTEEVVSQTREEINNKYSMFYLELEISEVSGDHDGTYYCNVKYKVDTMDELLVIQQQFTVSTTQPTEE